MTRFDDRIVLVTGATGGIGEETCRRLASEGAILVVADLPGTPVDELASALTGPTGTPHLAITLDVSAEEDWIRALSTVTATYGRLDVLVNNAAIGSQSSLEGETFELWQRVIDVDQTGAWLGMKYAGPAIEVTGGGAIVNVCSILGSVGAFGDTFAYHAAKGAVRSMTKNAAMHWARRGVRVHSLHPGYIATPRLTERHRGTQRYREMMANTPMGRLGTPSEIAGCVAFLASDDAGFMTGAELYADGGWTAR